MLRNPDSGMWEIFACGIRNTAKGIRNTAQGIRNPTNDWNPESKFHGPRLESSTWNPESTAWNQESQDVLDALTWGDRVFVLQRRPLRKSRPDRRIFFFSFIQPDSYIIQTPS